MKFTIRMKGGKGSGFHGHSGRPGMVGGSSAGRTLPLTKNNVGKFIQWSSSRYNEYKKSHVVDTAMKIIKGEMEDIHWGVPNDYPGVDVRPIEPLGGESRVAIKVNHRIFSAGSYTSSGSMGGSDYLINGKDRSIARGYARTNKIEDFVVSEKVYFEE